MPNYNQTIIYKFCCKDTTIKDIYVGSTCNFTRRKFQHKSACNTETSKRHHLKVYSFIRENGGWTNWDMIMIEQFSCENKREKEQRERYWIDELKPSLNSVNPFTTKEEKKTQMKEYYENNKDTLKQYSKDYYEKNRDSIKELRFNKRDERKEYDKLYRQKNKELTSQYNKVKVECNICNKLYHKKSLSRHQRTCKNEEIA